MTKAKPYAISKQVVWEAYKKVKANRGAAGVDGQSVAAFEEDLKNNLYKLWNRMSSGSYFPPPVLRVEIPKGTTGATRPLGIPTVSDRIAQMVVKSTLEPLVEPHFHPDSYHTITHNSPRCCAEPRVRAQNRGRVADRSRVFSGQGNRRFCG
jgi:RNA-directed DNA polymerase